MGFGKIHGAGGGFNIRNGSIRELYGRSTIPARNFVTLKNTATTTLGSGASAVCKVPSSDEHFAQVTGTTLYIRDIWGSKVSSLSLGFSPTQSSAELCNVMVAPVGDNQLFVAAGYYDKSVYVTCVVYTIVTIGNNYTLKKSSNGEVQYQSSFSNSLYDIGGCSFGSDTHLLLIISSGGSNFVYLINKKTLVGEQKSIGIQGKPFCIDEENHIIGCKNGIYEFDGSSLTALVTSSNSGSYYNTTGLVVSKERFLSLTSANIGGNNFYFTDFYKENGTWKTKTTTLSGTTNTSTWIAYWSDSKVMFGINTTRTAELIDHTLTNIVVGASYQIGSDAGGSSYVSPAVPYVYAIGGGVTANQLVNSGFRKSIHYVTEQTVLLRTSGSSGGYVTKTGCSENKKGQVYC